MKNKDKLIAARNKIYNIFRSSAKEIKKIDANVVKIEIRYELNFLTGVCPTKPLTGNMVLNQNDKSFWFHSCPNPDCTGNGFYLTDEINEAIRTHKPMKGKKHCEGKEDWKYLDVSGCTCMTTLTYEIIPYFCKLD